MKALLVRIGVDQAYGGWNAPVDAEGQFVYVPIPESPGTRFHPGLERRYGELLPALQRFCEEHDCDLCGDLRFPQELLERPMHLDPDFECLTYGDVGGRRGGQEWWACVQAMYSYSTEGFDRFILANTG